MRFLIDEDLPRSTAKIIQKYEHEGIDVRDIGLRGAEDSQVAAIAKERGLCLLTGDFDFADIRNYPPKEYPGIVIFYIPSNVTVAYILSLIESFLQQEQILEQLPGKLAIVEADRIRIRNS
ncbi:DUF5615 family PIN-like protein [Okeania sp. KiyG1]|uniref:DUF5615 family PIN-like protein n=1 Tax=Okeania sp. KiyG1 TaxID=2720165 RepID=UPI001922F99C|nr:DUF5615 family PIN-like protein [Okeania sp. KiyG1]GGA04586.1 hypothetical protein CYANOKiyG1_16920 [Okeania sp. KiyG1]